MSDLDSPKDLLPVLVSLAKWFEIQEVPYALIGGAAIGLVVQPRATQDVDAVIWLDPDRAQRFIDAGVEFGFAARISDPIEFARRSRVLLLQHVTTRIGVDLSLGVLPFEQEMIERATEFSTPQLKIRVASPEDLIVTKAVAHRKRDLIDIDNLLAVYPNLDLARVRYWVAQFACVLEMPELEKDLEVLLTNRG